MFVYPPLGSNTGSLNEAPTATISGTNTGLFLPQGIALDTGRNIYVADEGIQRDGLSAGRKQHRAAQRGPQRLHQRGHDHRSDLSRRHRAGFQRQHLCGGYGRPPTYLSIRRGRAGLPMRRPSPPSAGATPGWGSTRHRAGFQRQHLCGGLLRRSVFVYPALGSSTGLLNEAPTATISGSNTGLRPPEGIALDSSGNIYVADSGPRQRVCLSGAGKQHRATQRGPHRHHQREQHRPGWPQGIALDSSGNIYVADCGESRKWHRQRVCLSAAGKQHRVLNGAPTATISGSNTGL